MDLALVPAAYGVNVVDKKLLSIIFVDCSGKPAGECLVPHEVVSPYLHLVRFSEGYQAVCVGKVVSPGRWAQHVPLQTVLRHDDVVLLCNQITETPTFPEQF